MTGDEQRGGWVVRFARALVVVGCVLLSVGLLAGFVNRQLLDAGSFARHADAVRADHEVASRAGSAMADAAIQQQPDLTALRPLLQSTGASVFASPAFGPAFRATVAPVHQALFSGGDDQLVVRVADVGLLLSAAASEHAPGVQVPVDVDATLARVADGSVGARTIRAADRVRTLTWLLPLLALLCFAGAAALRRDLRSTLRTGGIGMGVAGLVLTAGGLVTSVVVDRIDTPTFLRAVAVAGWDELAGPLLWLSVGIAVGGFALAYVTELVTGSRRRSHADLLGELAQRRHGLGPQVVGAATLLAVGLCAVIAPLTVLRVVVTLMGAAAVVVGAVRLVDLVGSAVTARLREGRARASERSGRRVAAVAVGAALLLLVGTVWNGYAGDTTYAVTPVAATVCNGSAELCSRPYDEVTFPGTHNSMAAADEPGWFKAEQPTGVVGQLDDGIRLFLIDSWYGRATNRAGVVATAGPSRDRAEAEVRRTYGARAADSALRLVDGAHLTPHGPTGVYLCHGLCELGSTPWEPLMVKVRRWLQRHPQEVVTFFLQDQVSPATTAAVFRDAGLLPMVYTPTLGRSWPTLGQMIESGRRIVVLSENESGGTTYPWLLPGFDWVQDTRFNSRTVSDMTCSLNRGQPDSPLVLVNHWLNNLNRRVSDARRVNAADVLGPRLDRCVKERGHVNYVAVDFYDQGDLFGQVDRLNGVPSPATR